MLVSVLIPCFNAERWVRDAITSALEQTRAEIEVIVIDDGSTDGSLEIIRSFEGRIRWETGSNRGSNPTRNRLLALARGTWLQYLDADDYLLPDKVASQVRCLDAHGDADVIYGPCLLEHVDEQGSRRVPLPIPEPHDPWILLARWYLPQTGAPLWRKQAVEAVGGWRDDQPACQEHELYLRLLMAGRRFCYCESGGAVYRQWSEQTLWKSDQARTRRLRLAIQDRIEDHLARTGGLTADRHWAINMSRFEMARAAWLSDRDEARAIVGRIRTSMPGFVPAGAAAPARYQRAYRMLGFAAAETLASWRRGVTQRAPAAGVPR